MACRTRASSSGVACTPSKAAAGSPGASLIMTNTATTTPSNTGTIATSRLRMYLYMALPCAGPLVGT